MGQPASPKPSQKRLAKAPSPPGTDTKERSRPLPMGRLPPPPPPPAYDDALTTLVEHMDMADALDEAPTTVAAMDPSDDEGPTAIADLDELNELRVESRTYRKSEAIPKGADATPSRAAALLQGARTHMRDGAAAMRRSAAPTRSRAAALRSRVATAFPRGAAWLGRPVPLWACVALALPLLLWSLLSKG